MAASAWGKPRWPHCHSRERAPGNRRQRRTTFRSTHQWDLQMHELSIAMSIVDMAQEEAERHGSAQVIAVHLRLGKLSGVVREALLSSYEMACAATALE